MSRWWVFTLVAVIIVLLASYNTQMAPWSRTSYMPLLTEEQSQEPSKIEQWDVVRWTSPNSPSWDFDRILQSASTEDSFRTRKPEKTSKTEKVKLTEDDKKECLRSLVTVPYGGRFGNNFMEWASALGVKRHLDEALPNDQRRVVALPRDLWRSLNAVFDGLPNTTSLVEEMRKRKVREGAATCSEIFPHPDAIADKVTPEWTKAFYEPQRAAGNKSLVLHKWVAFASAVQPVVEEVRTSLRFKRKFQEPAAIHLRSLANQVLSLEVQSRSASQVVLVGVHVRRKDYSRWLIDRYKKPANKFYFVRALQWMVWFLRTNERNSGYTSPSSTSHSPSREPSSPYQEKGGLSVEASALPRYVTPPPPQTLSGDPLIAVAVVSDDMRWVNETLIPALMKYITDEEVTGVHVFAAGSPVPMVDLALLTQCNHTIISYGTYGTTGAILSGGWNVVYNLHHPSYLTQALAKYLPQWVIMS